MVNDIQEIQELLQEAIDKVYEASDALKRASRMMEDLPYGYNVKGNMEAYVINYLTDGMDSISEKIEKYLEQTNELEVDDDNDDDSDDDDDSNEDDDDDEEENINDIIDRYDERS